MLLVGFLASVFMFAGSVDKTQALRKAQEFMPGKNFQEVKSVSKARGDASGNAFYVFNADNNSGFVIVSGDDRTVPILGYSRTGSIDMEKIPENLKWWLEGYARQIEALGISVKPAQRTKTRGADCWSAINPLIQTKWNQGTPYNLRCPDSKGQDWRDGSFATDDNGVYNTDSICVTGCVATAMAQVMCYWRWPVSSPGIESYPIGHYVDDTFVEDYRIKALPETSFNWNLMKIDYGFEETGESANEVAKLMRYCGQSVGMRYTLEASEASVSPSVLTNVFGYSKNIRRLYRDAYSTSQWEEIIYAELAANRPVLYSGQADVGGHQFIVDGYDGNGLFHMNWGWGGASDDYFVLSLADPHTQGIGGSATNSAFQFDQDALIGVKPGNNEETLTPQIKSDIDAMTTHKYTRASADDDFTGVQFRGAFYASYNMESTEALNVQVGWALCQNGQVKKVVSSDSYTIAAGKTSSSFYTNKDNLTFGAGLALGKYEVCQVYKFTDNDAWSLCAPYWTASQNYRTSFLMADVSETSLTVRQVQSSFTVNSMTTSENPSTGIPLDVTLNITNNGETFEQVVKLWTQKENATTWTCVATATRKIDPGESDDVVLSYIPTESGAFTLKVTNAKSDEALKTIAVFVYSSFETTINNLKFVCHTGTHKAKLVGNTYPSNPVVNVEIPATFDVDGTQYTVSEIANNALRPSNYQYNPIASLTIPSTVESIGDYAVYNCYRLTELRIPEGVKHIGENAFMACYALTTVSLPSTLLSIGDGAFAYNRNLKTVVTAMTTPCTINQSVFVVEKEVDGETVETFTSADLYVPIGKKTIYEAADVWRDFSTIYQGEVKDITINDITYTYVTGEDFAIVKSGDKTALQNKDVVIPSTIQAEGKTYNIKKIADKAFLKVLMNSLTIQPGVEEIGDDAFWNAYTIEDITIPSGVKRIGACAFQYCYWIETIELPASLTSIGDYAFGNISYLTSVVSHISKPFAISDNVFGVMDGDNLTPPTATLSVPAGTKTTYNATAGWKKFPTITETEALLGDADGSGEVDADDVKAVVRYIKEGSFEGFVFDNADVKKDGKVNIADLVKIIDIIKNP